MTRSLIAFMVALPMALGYIGVHHFRNSGTDTPAPPELECANCDEPEPGGAPAAVDSPTKEGAAQPISDPPDGGPSSVEVALARGASKPGESNVARAKPLAIPALPEAEFPPPATSLVLATGIELGGTSPAKPTSITADTAPAAASADEPPAAVDPRTTTSAALAGSEVGGGGLRWVSTPVVGVEVTPHDIAARSSAGISPYAVAMPRVTSQVTPVGQKEQGKDLETLPQPTPVRVLPADTPPRGLVSGAVLVDTVIPATPSGIFTADAEMALWLIPNQRLPVSVATPDALGATPSGIFTTVGDEHLNRHTVPGARVALGYWWVNDNPWVPGGKLPIYGIETRFLFVGERSVSSDIASPSLTRPFFNLNTNTPSAVVIATPGLATGFLSASASERMWGAEANFWSNLHFDWPGTTYSIDAMVGMRYLELNEGFQIGRSSAFVANPVGFPDYAFLAGNRITEQESISAQNRFLGGQVGIRANAMFDNVILTTQFQLAAGDTNEQLNVQGAQRRTLPSGQSIVSPGALFALPSNIGRHSRDEFALMPEIAVSLRFPINRHLTIGGTFTALYWSRIARPAEQVDRAVDITQIPNFPGAAAALPTGLARPGVPFNQSDLWLMGFMVSAEFKW